MKTKEVKWAQMSKVERARKKWRDAYNDFIRHKDTFHRSNPIECAQYCAARNREFLLYNNYTRLKATNGATSE